MDLARMIVDVSAEVYKKECKDSICSVDVCFNNRYKYSLSVIPMASHVLIEYKTIRFKVERSDKKEYDELISFLAKEIKIDRFDSLNSEIEFDGYWPDNDENFGCNSIKVSRAGEKVFFQEFEEDHFEKVLKPYLSSLRHAC